MIRLHVGCFLGAHCNFPKTFMSLLNSTFVQCCISTNLFQRNVNDGNCIAMQSFNLNVCTLFRLRVWAEKLSASSSDNSHISKYQQNYHENYHVLFVTVQITHCWSTKGEEGGCLPLYLLLSFQKNFQYMFIDAFVAEYLSSCCFSWVWGSKVTQEISCWKSVILRT